jgi:hypothetical protein
MSELSFPIFGDPEKDAIETATISAAKVIANMEPGDTIIIERFSYERGKNFYQMTIKARA